MGFNLKYLFLNFIFSNKVENIETQIQIHPNKTTQEYPIYDSALLLTLRLSQFIGIQPMYIQKRTSHIYIVSISPVIYILNIAISIIINGTALYGLFLILTEENHQIVKSKEVRFQNTDNYLIASVLIPVAVINISNTLYGIIRVRRILDCLECIEQIRHSIFRGSFQCLENRRKMCSVILFATFSPIILRFTAIGLSWKFSDIYQYMAIMQTVTVALLEIKFFLLVESLNLSFEAINKQLKEILSELNFYYLESSQRKKLSLRISHLMISFLESCKMLKKINRNENLMLLCYIIIFPLYIILSFYFLSHVLSNVEDANFSLIVVGREIFNTFNNIFLLWFIIEPCHQTQKKVNETKHFVAEIMCHIQSKDDSLLHSVDTFYKLLMLNHYTFTAMDVCDIGRPLISKIFGLAFTVLMVLKF